MDQESSITEIQEFYQGGTALVTGGTGYLGKLILEKLLSATEISKIYLLIRKKDNVSPKDRLQHLLQSSIFDNLKRGTVDHFRKVEVIVGDAEEQNLGLDKKTIDKLKNEVTNVIHTAVAAKINQNFREACMVNIRATRDLLEMAKEMKKLKSFVFISSAFSNCPRDIIDEKFYDVGIDSEEFLSLLEKARNENEVMEKYKDIMASYPNTFTFTMGITENMIQKNAMKLPIAIVRSSLIIATNNGPVRGFIDSCHGPTGIVLGVGMGLLRVFYGKLDQVGDMVPADYVINNALAAGWAINEYRLYDKLEKIMTKEKIPIFNCVSSTSNPVTWDEFSECMDEYAKESPTAKMMWYPYKIHTTCIYNYLMLKFLLHSLPAMVCDLILSGLGKRPVAQQFYKRMDNFSESIQYFTNRSWDFNDTNNKELYRNLSRKDKELFNFNVDDIEWRSYFEYYLKGIRVYVLKDDMSTVQKGRSKLFKLKMLHYASLSAGFVILYFIARVLLKWVLNIFIDI